MNFSFKLLLVLLLALFLHKAQILQPKQLKNDIFSFQITGDLEPLQPTTFATSDLWPYPVEVYEIAMMRAKHQFLPQRYSPTTIFAYAGKVNDQFKPQYPGPSILAFKNMPVYVIWSNNIEGGHILPVDTNPPFQIIGDYLNEVPVVPHAHGLETEMGTDGQPMGFWTKSGRKGPDFFSLSSKNRKRNQAIFRYHNTKQGLFWFHDHTMGITRLNVYAGLVGFYQIVDPEISLQQKNILKLYGDIQRKYFIISDKSFDKNGQLYYPKQSESSSFKSWVPQFFGNTITVNGKIWPKIMLRPALYRFVFLNGCQSRFLNIYFEYKSKKLPFHLFRRDSDFLRKPVRLDQHLLLIGGRIQIFIDLTNAKGEVLLKNNAKTPFPQGDEPTEYTSKILKIVVKEPKTRKLQQKLSLKDFLTKGPKNIISMDVNTNIKDTQEAGVTFTKSIQKRIHSYTNSQLTSKETIDFIDENQASNYNPSLKIQSQSSNKRISLVDFLNSNDNTDQSLVFRNAVSEKQNIQKIVQDTKFSLIQFLQQNPDSASAYSTENQNDFSLKTVTNVPYPRFSQGIPYFTTLFDVKNNKGQLSGVMIDGVPVKMGCKGSSFKQGQTYDFYIINLTMDDHPIHIHIVNFQVIGRFSFNIDAYKNEWQKKNGPLRPGGYNKIPNQIDARKYRTSPIEGPFEEQKQFLDVILIPSEKVTIARVKFSNHYGKSFPFEVNGARYVWHCHILEHQDNQMMRYFCIQ